MLFLSICCLCLPGLHPWFCVPFVGGMRRCSLLGCRNGVSVGCGRESLRAEPLCQIQVLQSCIVPCEIKKSSKYYTESSCLNQCCPWFNGRAMGNLLFCLLSFIFILAQKVPQPMTDSPGLFDFKVGFLVLHLTYLSLPQIVIR